MAGSENEIVVTTKVETDDAKRGVEDLFAQIDRMKSQLEGVGGTGLDDVAEGAQRAGGAFDGLAERAGVWGGIVSAVGAVFAAEMDEIYNSLEKTTKAYDEATDAVRKYHDEQEKLAKSGKATRDRLGDDDPKLKAAHRELGYGDMGFAASSTWTGSAQRAGQHVTDFFSGDDTVANAEAHGKKVAQRQLDIDKNNEKEHERRKFQEKADENRWKEEQKHAHEYAKEQHRLDEQERREREQQDGMRWKQQNKEAEDYFKNSHKLDEEGAKKDAMQKKFADQEQLNDMSRPTYEKDFKSHQEGLEDTYKRVANAAASNKEDPQQKAFDQRLKIWEEHKRLRQEEHKVAMEKQDKVIETLESKLGLA